MKSKLIAALVISASALFASAGVQAQDAPPDADVSVQQPAPQENGPQQDDSQQNDSQQNAPQPGIAQQQEGPQQEGPQQQGTDSAAGVARISLIHGAVSTQRGDSADWATAVLNAPIVSGDKVSTGDNSRAEVTVGAETPRLESSRLEPIKPESRPEATKPEGSLELRRSTQ